MDKKKTRILIVDDEPEIVFALRHSLSIRGYQAAGALNAEEALCCLEKEKSDLILLDIMMPGMKGTDFARFIKERYPRIKIIMVTAYPDEAKGLSKDNTLEALLTKPIKLQDLCSQIEAIDYIRRISQLKEPLS